jgi:uncharacterized protein (TIGR02453 family)
MNAQVDLEPVLGFLRALRRNNNREWFHAHRSEYEAARLRFEDYIALLINELSPTEPLGDITPKDCTFRINRDLRFTRDRTPYNAYMSAYIAPGGRKSTKMGYYVHIEPGHSLLAGGIHERNSPKLAAWRASIDRDPAPFRQIIEEESFRKYFGEVSGDRLKTAPRGYPRDHPDLDLLRLKTVTVTREIADRVVASPDFVEETLRTFRAMKPFLAYMDSLPESA